MAFQFAYSLDGSAVSNIKDFPLDTVANYKSGAGTNDVKKGDGVLLNAGLIRRQANAASPKIIGVVEGLEFTGLVASGQPYAAVNSSFTASATDTTKFPNGVVKVRVESDSVYRIPVTSGQTATNANLGVAYGISLSAAGDQTVDLTNTTNLAVKVVDRSADGKTVYVVVSSNSTF
jgi:hypothetical protein